MDFLERLEQSLIKLRLAGRGARVVVAVSGGVDSMVLLQALHALALAHGWKLSVAHFNHRLRGRSSAADERLVRATARRLKLPCDVAEADVRAAADKQGISLEMAARDLRHAFLARCARKRRARIIALAHHADDQVELFFLRLLRGAGGEGLGGMKARSVSPADRQILLVRPLLEFTKEDLTEYARVEHIRFREDASNASAAFERNWVRHELLPLLRQRQPAIGRTILRAMELSGAEADFVTQAAEAALGRLHCTFAELPAAVQRRAVQLQLRRLKVEADYALVEELRGQPNRRVSAGPGRYVLCDATGRVRVVKEEPRAFARGERVVELRGDGGKAGEEAGDRGLEGKSRKQKAEIWKSRTKDRDRDRLKPGLRTGKPGKWARGWRMEDGGWQGQAGRLRYGEDGAQGTPSRTGKLRPTGPGEEASGERRDESRRPKAATGRRTPREGRGQVEFAGRRFAWRMVRRPREGFLRRGSGVEYFDADKVGSIMRLRHWRAGDRFQPIGLSASTKLQDWFTNRKIPMARRRQLVLAENERGEVFWVEGERIGEGCKVTPATRRVLEWRQVKSEARKPKEGRKPKFEVGRRMGQEISGAHWGTGGTLNLER
jgi:tRNA(Ile)-lysidine synthase